ncbi:MAG: hypothetical protein JSV58_02385 [Candidatus Bathyarchaeota archaeon]|nr:MAG: hypothetical protein JSV58_02385 [Candidatus Bathyarchaeota archaeon]
MRLEELASKFEKLRIQFSEQSYNQDAGLPYDKDLMKNLATQLTQVSQDFLTNFEKPRNMYLISIAAIAVAEKLETELELHEQRVKKISTDKYEIAGRTVNWGTWRQFNSITDNPTKRKEVFDDFVKKALSIAPLVEKRMSISRDIYSRYSLTPLDSYLELEGLEYNQLHSLLMKLGDGARDAFLAAAEHLVAKVLGKKNFEYYDDFYTWRGRIYRPLGKHFEKIDGLDEVRRFLVTFGFDPSRIKVDAEDREKKSPSAFCFGIQIPNDIRICFRKVSPFTDFGSIFHEFGHAIHGASANPNDSVWKRYVVPMSVAETFSILIESMLDTPLFLKQELGLVDRAVNEIVDRRRFMNLAFLTFYAANSIMKMEFWKKRYSIEDAAKRWQELTKRFFIEVPGDYWLLHHVMPSYDMYSPSYMIASLRVAAVRERLRQDYGEIWWKSKKAGNYIRDLAATRGDFDIKAWNLDAESYLKDVKTLSFL